MEQTKPYKKIIGILSVVSIFLFGGIYFVYDQIKIKNENILNIEQELSSKNSRTEYFISLQNLVDSISPEIEKIESSIVPKSGDVSFIEELESLAKNSGLLIEIESLNLTSDQKDMPENLVTFKVKAKASGTWNGIYTFLYKMESLNYKIKINKFILVSKDELTAIRDSSQKKEWQANFEINVLEYK